MSAGIDYKSLYEEKSKAFDALQLTVISLQHQLTQLQKMIFGSRHERFVADSNPSQLSLDITAEPEAACSVVDTKKISYTRTKLKAETAPFLIRVA